MATLILDIPKNPDSFPREKRNWSASTLNEVEQCPKQYVLSRSNFPNLWEKNGFPKRINAAQIKGVVVHSVVSKILNFVKSSKVSPELSAMEFLKDNGGYLQIIKSSLDEELAKFGDNPRAERFIDHIRKQISVDISEVRSQVQYFVRASIQKIAPTSDHRNVAKRTMNGTSKDSLSVLMSEYRIVDREFPLEGYLDLLVTSGDKDLIVDYKTSKVIHDEYWKQLELYAWLWFRDSANIRKGDCVVEVVSGSFQSQKREILSSEIEVIESSLIKRMQWANAAINSEHVQAIPSEAGCKFCSVKAMCDTYWNSNSILHDKNAWNDVRVTTKENIGGNVWRVLVEEDNSDALLVLGNAVYGSISSEQELRVLSARLMVDDEMGKVIRLGESSEIFRVV